MWQKTTKGIPKMDSQSAETSDSSLCLAALAHFLDRIDQDTKEWNHAINGDHNGYFGAII